MKQILVKQLLVVVALAVAMPAIAEVKLNSSKSNAFRTAISAEEAARVAKIDGGATKAATSVKSSKSNGSERVAQCDAATVKQRGWDPKAKADCDRVGNPANNVGTRNSHLVLKREGGKDAASAGLAVSDEGASGPKKPVK